MEWEVNQISVTAVASLLERCRIDLSKDYEPVDFLLSRNEVGCLPRGDLQVITGKQKAGKSFAISCLIVALLRGEFMGFKAMKESIRVLHIDTEQHKSNVLGKYRTIHYLCDWDQRANNEQLITLSLRESTNKERMKICVEAIKCYSPDLVVIDGIRDLCYDFNDIEESATLVGQLMKLSTEHKIAIISVLHENKGDTNMRGHLGTELANKCSETYKISKDGNTIKVEQVICRNAPIDSWTFEIGENGIPIPTAIIGKAANKLFERASHWNTVFQQQTQFKHGELIAAYMETANCGISTAKNHMKEALDAGSIIKEGFYYSRNENKVGD